MVQPEHRFLKRREINRGDTLTNASSSPVTPFRKTHVVFDSDEPVVVQPAVSFERVSGQMARSTSSNRVDVVNIPAIGWRISSYACANFFLDQRTSAQDNYLTSSGGSLLLATGVQEAPRVRKIVNADVTGIDTGSSSDLASTAAPFYRRMWTDTDDVSTLGMSTAGFNQPDTTDTSYVMDRIAESTSQYGSEDPFFFQFDVPGTTRSASQAIASLYFPGPASQTVLTNKSIVASTEATYETGRGEYCLKLYGDGKAVLFERLTTGSPYTWKSRTSFSYAASGKVFGTSHFITITGMKQCDFNGGKGGVINFRMGTYSNVPNTGAGSVLYKGINITTAYAATMPGIGETHVYNVPNASNSPVASHDCQLRVDISRELRGVEFCVGVAKYKATGTLTCDKFKHGGLSISTGVDTDHPYVLQWNAYIPTGSSDVTGCAVDLKLYSAVTNAEISTPVVVNSYTKNYPLPANFTDSMYVVATLTASTSRKRSPTLISYKVYRDALYGNTGMTGVDFTTDSSGGKNVLTRVISEFQMYGAERDVSHEMATIKGADLLGTYTPLRTRSGIPAMVWTQYDPADATKRLYLFDGYVSPTDTIPIPGGGSSAINAKRGITKKASYMFDLQANGKWQRLKEYNFTATQQLMQKYDSVSGTYTPWKVTELVAFILSWCGFDSSQIDITDSPIVVWTKNGDPWFGNAPNINLLDAIQDLLYTYLGSFLVWDRALGTYGKWRVLPQVRAPYTNVAAFVTTGPPQTDGTTRVGHNAKSYPLASTLADGFTYTPTAPVIPMSRGTVRDQVIPPEGNFLYVSYRHTGDNPDPESGDHSVQVLFNRKSFNFDPRQPTADSTDPDYLGRYVPIYYFLPSLAAGNSGIDDALKIIARRIYDFACHAKFLRDFEAPIVPITHESDATKVRNLRYYDPVTVDGVQYIVRNANPHFTSDFAQMQMLQVEKPNF
jgi:hypothetical protein